MHFSIPDTSELQDTNSSSFTVFNIHINGVFHCSARYKQLLNFHEQLKIQFGNCIPSFPPKRWLSLNSTQLEERRLSLERYIQTVSQDPRICNSDLFIGFLLHAQQETQSQDAQDVTIEVYLMNGNKVRVDIVSTDQTERVLEITAAKIHLHDDYVYYFGLFLIEMDKSGSWNIVRKIQDFESPYISLCSAKKDGAHRIVIRKSYWDSAFDDDLLDDDVAMNLLYVEAVADVERGWIQATDEQQKQLQVLQDKGSRRQYIQLARTLKYYGYFVFKPCLTDYPHHDSQVIVAAGHKELNFRVQIGDDVKEGCFKVTRMRCWRLTTTIADPKSERAVTGNNGETVQLELAFEYLMARDTLQWVRIVSDQAIVMSVCLQRMVDELLLKKQGKRFKKPQERLKQSTSQHVFLKRDGSSHLIKSASCDGKPNFGLATKADGPLSNDKRDTAPSSYARNRAYEVGVSGIGDDDL